MKTTSIKLYSLNYLDAKTYLFGLWIEQVTKVYGE